MRAVPAIRLGALQVRYASHYCNYLLPSQYICLVYTSHHNSPSTSQPPLERSTTGRTSSSGSTSTSGKYAADKSVEAQGDVLRARRAQASPMGSPVGSPAGHGAGLGLGLGLAGGGGGLSPKSPGGGGGAAYDDQYAGPTPGGAPPSPGSPAKSSSFGRFLGGWK